MPRVSSERPPEPDSGRLPARRPRSARGQGQQLRADLLDAAVTVLDGLGHGEALSLRAVARAAGVTPNAVYLHFDDRDELILAVLERLSETLAARRDDAERKAAADGGDLWEQLVARSLAYVRWGLREPGAYRVLYGGQAVPRLAEPRAMTFGQTMLDRTVELVALMLDAGQAAPCADAERVGLLIWTALHGIVSLRIDKDTIAWPPPEELAVQALTALVVPATR